MGGAETQLDIQLISIQLNGEPLTVRSRTVAELLNELELGGRKVAVELNKEIIGRDNYSSTGLNGGDQIEIIHFVGGG